MTWSHTGVGAPPHTPPADPRETRETPHAARVRFLDALARLAGCHGALGGQLPDGRRPDVLRVGFGGRRLLFVGDAKDTETPGCAETRRRLRRYLDWMRAHLDAGGAGVFAVCFGRGRDAEAWLRTGVALALRARVRFAEAGVTEFAEDCHVAWFVGGPTAPRPDVSGRFAAAADAVSGPSACGASRRRGPGLRERSAPPPDARVRMGEFEGHGWVAGPTGQGSSVWERPLITSAEDHGMVGSGRARVAPRYALRDSGSTRGGSLRRYGVHCR